MKIREITSVIEQAAPLFIQENWDNTGLIVGHPDQQVESALVCVDITEQVMDEAEANGIGMVISHHPVIFHPLRHITGGTYVERVVERAIKAGIALYACHTNLDAAPGGMSWKVGHMLGLTQMELLCPKDTAIEGTGFGVVGELPESLTSVKFLAELKNKMGLKVIRHSDICRVMTKKVAVSTGAGASFIDLAASKDADVYISSDFKYNDFLDADNRLIIADIGHFESEYCAIDLLYDIIRKKMPIFAVRKSQSSRNPINYFI